MRKSVCLVKKGNFLPPLGVKTLKEPAKGTPMQTQSDSIREKHGIPRVFRPVLVRDHRSKNIERKTGPSLFYSPNRGLNRISYQPGLGTCPRLGPLTHGQILAQKRIRTSPVDAGGQHDLKIEV
jgi:hypothetical protein